MRYFLVYADAAAVTSEVHGQRYEKCLELLNVMVEADVLTALSVQGGAPQYLMLARKPPYQDLAKRFPKYAQIEEPAGNEKIANAETGSERKRDRIRVELFQDIQKTREAFSCV